MNAGYLTVLAITPAAAGWRRVYWKLPDVAHDDELSIGEVEDAPDSELLWTAPIACFALVENEDELRYVVPVVPDDWPEMLSIELDKTGDSFGIGYLAPGAELDENHGAEARKSAVAYLSERGAS